MSLGYAVGTKNTDECVCISPRTWTYYDELSFSEMTEVYRLAGGRCDELPVCSKKDNDSLSGYK